MLRLFSLATCVSTVFFGNVCLDLFLWQRLLRQFSFATFVRLFCCCCFLQRLFRFVYLATFVSTVFFGNVCFDCFLWQRLFRFVSLATFESESNEQLAGTLPLVRLPVFHSSSVQFKVVSMRSEMPICAPPHLSEMSPASPLKQFQCWSA